MEKEQLLVALGEAFEGLIALALQLERLGQSRSEEAWGPRETIAHLAAWEAMAAVRIPAIVGGMAPLEETDAARQEVMNDAINAVAVTLSGDQSLEALCEVLRRAYQRDIEILRTLDASHFQPGQYVYERTRGVIEHCQEHAEALTR